MANCRPIRGWLEPKGLTTTIKQHQRKETDKPTARIQPVRPVHPKQSHPSAPTRNQKCDKPQERTPRPHQKPVERANYVNVNVQIKLSADQLANLTLNSKTASRCTKQNPKTSIPKKPRNPPKPRVNRNDQSSVIVTQKLTSVCKIVKK